MSTTVTVDKLRFLALDEPSRAPRKIRAELKKLAGDALGRGRLVLAGHYLSNGKVKTAVKTAAQAEGCISSDLGFMELLGFRLSLLRDTGEPVRALALARSGILTASQDNEIWYLGHFNLALAEGATGSQGRAAQSWTIASNSARPIYSVGASVNLSRDLISSGETSLARDRLQRAQAHSVPRKLAAIRSHTWSRLVTAEGDLEAAVQHQRQALEQVVGLNPLLVARHSLALIETLVRSSNLDEARIAVAATRRLVFDLAEERQEVAAAAMLGLCKAAAAQGLTAKVVAVAQRKLESEPNRWGRSIRGRG